MFDWSLESVWQVILLHTAGQVDWACSCSCFLDSGILSSLYLWQLLFLGGRRKFSWNPEGIKGSFSLSFGCKLQYVSLKSFQWARISWIYTPTITPKNEMLPWSIHWVACGTCYRKSEGTELCGIEIQHSSLRRITNKREARNIGFWADMLIIFKFPHNFFSPQVCPLSIWLLCNTKIHWS